MSWDSPRWIAVALAVVLAPAGVACFGTSRVRFEKAPSPGSRRFDAWATMHTQELRSAHPEADAVGALAHGDSTLLAIAGLRLMVPSCEDSLCIRFRLRHGIIVLAGTSDDIQNSAQQQLIAASQEYARRYNDVVVAHIPAPAGPPPGPRP